MRDGDVREAGAAASLSSAEGPRPLCACLQTHVAAQGSTGRGRCTACRQREGTLAAASTVEGLGLTAFPQLCMWHCSRGCPGRGGRPRYVSSPPAQGPPLHAASAGRVQASSAGLCTFTAGKAVSGGSVGVGAAPLTGPAPHTCRCARGVGHTHQGCVVSC